MRYLAVLCVSLSVACQPQPSISCDRERLFVAVDDQDIEPSDDIDPATPGLQIDLVVNSTLGAGAPGFLFIIDEDGNETQFNTVAQPSDSAGRFFFNGVTLPQGQVTLNVVSSSECRLVETNRDLFVFDDMGAPTCLVSLSAEPVARDLIDDPVLNAALDDDPGAADLQTTIRVDTGRDDVDIAVLVRDTQTGDERRFDELSGEDAAAEFSVTLGQGTQAIRAFCRWTEFPDLPIPSATLELFVDTVTPGCALTEPSAAVSNGDDLDGDSSNGVQFAMVGTVIGGDADGTPASFVVNGAAVEGSAVEGGTSSGTGELPFPPNGAQDFAFFAEDRAGNPCSASASF